MARANYLYTEFSLNALKDRIQQKSGIKVVTMRNCNELAGHLATHDLHISAHTLARFFRVIANTNMPSHYSLDQLSIYIGYSNWNDFHQKVSNGRIEHSNGQTSISQLNLSDSELALVKFSLQDSAFTPLTNYIRLYKDIFIDPLNPKTAGLLTTITEVLNSYPKIRHRIFDFMVKEEFLGRNYFTYQINADAIASYYGDAVSEYFMKLLHPSETHYKAQLTWAHAIIMMQAFYQGNKKKLLHYGYELFRLSPPEHNTLDMHIDADENRVWIFARYHFVHILYLHFSGKASTRTIEQKVRFISDQLTQASHKCKFVTYSFIFEALTFIGFNNLVLWFTNDYSDLINSINCDIKFRGENLKAITAVIFFFTLATSQNLSTSDVNSINTKLEGVKKAVSKTDEFKPYISTYHVYLHSLNAILAEDTKLRNQYLTDARQHAQHLKNKYFINQIDRMFK